MTIEERRCPRCHIKRTVRLGAWGSVCFNCRRPLDATPTIAEPIAPSPREVFTPAELARLGSYRAAILAGLYTDWPAEAELI